jgi:hypothetical protein
MPERNESTMIGRTISHYRIVSQLGYHVAWQFSVDPDIPYCHWRAHGILIDDTFFPVWLDPDHQLWPDA